MNQPIKSFITLSGNNFLKALFWALATILLLAIIFHSVSEIYTSGLISRSGVRAIYGLFATSAVLYFSYYFVFLRKPLGEITDIFKPVLFFNISIIFLFYYAGFEFGLARNDFKVGFTYGNFWDFYYQALTAAERTYEAINTGYLPFSYALSIIYAKLLGWKKGFHPITAWTVVIYLSYLVE